MQQRQVMFTLSKTKFYLLWVFLVIFISTWRLQIRWCLSELVKCQIIARLKVLLLQQICHEESYQHSSRQATKLSVLFQTFFRLWFCSGLRRTPTILSTNAVLESHNLLWRGIDRHLGSVNVLAVCVSKIVFAYICIKILIQLD